MLGQELTNKTPRAIIDAGIAHVPESRIHVGSVGSMNVADNIALKHYRDRPGPFLDRDGLDKMSTELVDEFNVDTPGITTNAGALSGGNLQKLISGSRTDDGPEADHRGPSDTGAGRGRDGGGAAAAAGAAGGRGGGAADQRRPG